MVDVPEVLQRSWLAELGERARRDRLPAGGVLAAVARRCAEWCSTPPGLTPLLAGAFGDALAWSEIGPEPHAVLLGPDLVGQVAEILTAAGARRSGGVHYTPPALADRLTAAVVRLDPAPGSVCDPSVGGGAFLLAVARRMVASTGSARTVVERLAGVDVDPLAVAAAEAALALFAAERGTTVAPTGLLAADSLGLATEHFPLRPDAGYDLVIGNPPFGGQLKGATRLSASGAGRDEAAIRRRGRCLHRPFGAVPAAGAGPGPTGRPGAVGAATIDPGREGCGADPADGASLRRPSMRSGWTGTGRSTQRCGSAPSQRPETAADPRPRSSSAGIVRP